MARIDWNLRSRGRNCLRCDRPFEAGGVVHSAVLPSGDEFARELFAEAFAAEDAAKAAGQPVKDRPDFLRADFCAECWKALPKRDWTSAWRSKYEPPPADPVDPVKKASPESVLRSLLEGPEPENHAAAIYLLAVMLERKRILVERGVKPAPNGVLVHIYEHRRSGDILLVADPGLAEGEIDEARTEIEILLGLREAPATSGGQVDGASSAPADVPAEATAGAPAEVPVPAGAPAGASAEAPAGAPVEVAAAEPSGPQDEPMRRDDAAAPAGAPME